MTDPRDRFQPGWLLGALVAGVMALAFTSTWYRREETVGEGFAATTYGVLALALWIGTAACVALAFGWLGPRRG